MSLIKKNQKPIEIKLRYKEVPTSDPDNPKIMIISDENYEKIKGTDEEKNVIINTTKWKKLTWEDQNKINEEALFFNEERNSYDVNVFKLRDARLKKSLIGWDLVDENNQPIPLNPFNINLLPDQIVNYLLEKYEGMTSLSELEKKV